MLLQKCPVRQWTCTAATANGERKVSLIFIFRIKCKCIYMKGINFGYWNLGVKDSGILFQFFNMCHKGRHIQKVGQWILYSVYDTYFILLVRLSVPYLKILHTKLSGSFCKLAITWWVTCFLPSGFLLVFFYLKSFLYSKWVILILFLILLSRSLWISKYCPTEVNVCHSTPISQSFCSSGSGSWIN